MCYLVFVICQLLVVSCDLACVIVHVLVDVCELLCGMCDWPRVVIMCDGCFVS